MNKIFSSFMMIFLMAAIATSCSKDDEPQDYQPTYDGVTIYLNAIEKLYDSDGKPAYTPTSTEGIYVCVADSREIAYGFICQILDNKDWDGKNVNVKLGENGELGSIKVVSDGLADGIFYDLIIDIKGDEQNYEPYTLQIISEEKAKDDNGIVGEGVIKVQLSQD